MRTLLNEVKPLKKVTLPVGVPAPEDGLTVAVSATALPWTTLVAEAASAVVVGPTMVPVPSRVAVTWALFRALELAISIAVREPAADGVKVTATVQELPGATAAPGSHPWAAPATTLKSAAFTPLIANRLELANCNGALPVLNRCEVCVTL